jgi:predicted acyl esterase
MAEQSTGWPKTVVENGMRIEYDLPIVMSDGNILRANLYRPAEDGQFPVIASLGAYGKDHPFQEPPYAVMWQQMVERYPEVLKNSSGRYASFEVPDPENWVPFGYAVLRIDSRGAGRSEGFMDTHSYQESVDYAECIGWAAAQPWSNGKLGLSGISYFAVNQWIVSTLQPKGLAALCIWEGASDWYRDTNYHGGIPCSFLGKWFNAQATIVQHGLGSRGPKNPYTGIQIAGDIDLTKDELRANRLDVPSELKAHPFDGEFWRLRSADLSRVHTPLLSAGNFAGAGLHGRSNFKGFEEAASEHKYLEAHGHEHWTVYYTEYGLNLQRRFFDYYLKGEGDWEQTQPKVLLQIRHVGDVFVPREEKEWPLARTEWTKLFFRPGSKSLEWTAPAEDQASTYEAYGDGLTMVGEPLSEQMEITGPASAKLFVSSNTTDADLFVVLRVFDPDGKEVLFQGANDPKTPIGQGWLRASHRKLDPEQSRPWRPYHPHLEEEPLEPGRIYELSVEIWPTSLVIPAGYRIGFTILGRDFDHGLESVDSHMGPQQRGSAFFLHDERPDVPYRNNVTIHSGPDRQSYVLLPIIPGASE